MVHCRMWKQNPRDQESFLSSLKDEDWDHFAFYLQAFTHLWQPLPWLSQLGPSLTLLIYVAVIRHPDKIGFRRKSLF